MPVQTPKKAPKSNVLSSSKVNNTLGRKTGLDKKVRTQKKDRVVAYLIQETRIQKLIDNNKKKLKQGKGKEGEIKFE